MTPRKDYLENRRCILRDRVARLWERHRRTFWIAHSIWALATGVVVLVLSHERYRFVPWVVGCLGLTWASTLFFSRTPRRASGENSLRTGLASYVTRVFYQETLFFLLPFYAYSAVVPSWNLLFLLLLAGLAVLACLDLVFDRWLRELPVFGMVFFTVVAFAALNLLLPMMIGLRLRLATGVSAVLAVGSAVPFALRSGVLSRGGRLRVGAAAAAILAVAFLARPLVPPVPLRLERVTFGTGFDRERFTVTGSVGHDPNGAASTPASLVVLAEVFAPSSVPARVVLEWSRDGDVLRTSREVEIVAHRSGFRVWDHYRPEDGALPPGPYRIVLRTADGQLFGSAGIRLP